MAIMGVEVRSELGERGDETEEAATELKMKVVVVSLLAAHGLWRLLLGLRFLEVSGSGHQSVSN